MTTVFVVFKIQVEYNDDCYNVLDEPVLDSIWSNKASAEKRRLESVAESLISYENYVFDGYHADGDKEYIIDHDTKVVEMQVND